MASWFQHTFELQLKVRIAMFITFEHQMKETCNSPLPLGGVGNAQKFYHFEKCVAMKKSSSKSGAGRLSVSDKNK